MLVPETPSRYACDRNIKLIQLCHRTIVLAAPTDMFERTTPKWYVCARSTQTDTIVLTAPTEVIVLPAPNRYVYVHNTKPMRLYFQRPKQ